MLHILRITLDYKNIYFLIFIIYTTIFVFIILEEIIIFSWLSEICTILVPRTFDLY